MKRCTRCKKRKRLKNFPTHRQTKDGHDSWCRSCKNKYTLAYRHLHLDAVRQKDRGRGRQLRYGISKTDFLSLLVAQDHKCAICDCSLVGDRNQNLDHDHETRQIRAILCNKCNLGLGHFRDNSTFLLRASNYVKKYDEIYQRSINSMETGN
jgi:hypothetical protein